MTRRAKIMLLAFALLVILVVCGLAQPIVRKRRLETACVGADRVVVDFNVLPERSRAPADLPAFPAFEVNGKDKVGELLELLSFRVSVPGLRCRCFGQVVLRFFRGDERLASLSLHHSKNLRWRGGKWSGDAALTKASRKALFRWICDKTGRPLEEIYDELTRSCEAWRAGRRTEKEPGIAITQSQPAE